MTDTSPTFNSQISPTEIFTCVMSCHASYLAHMPTACLPALHPAFRHLQRLPRSSWRDVRYKGDPLTRPIASFELGLLVRLLVALSLRLNAWLELDRPWTPGEDPPENRFQVRCSGVG